jgi:hypothetical protein
MKWLIFARFRKDFVSHQKNQAMAKVTNDKVIKPLKEERAKKEWSEGELMEAFHLTRIVTYLTPEMEEWLQVSPLILNVPEQYIFDKALLKSRNIFQVGRKKI